MIADKVAALLDAIEAETPIMKPEVDAARVMAVKLPDDIIMPRVWTDGIDEVVLEWVAGPKHVIAAFVKPDAEISGTEAIVVRKTDAHFGPATFDEMIAYLRE